MESGKRNAQLTSKTVQNEIIGVIGEYIRNEVTKPLQLPSAVYTIIADEVTDKYSVKDCMGNSPLGDQWPEYSEYRC